jgi:hypothetical protein
MGVNHLTGEVRPVKIDNVTGGVLISVVGTTDPGAPTQITRALHDDNNVPTMTGVNENDASIACARIDNRTVNEHGGYLWVTDGT